MQETGATTEIAKVLGVGASTLRKYAAALEEKGYGFERAVNQSRVYREQDIECFRSLKSMLRENNMTMSEAVEVVLTELGHKQETLPLPEEAARDLMALVEEVTAAPMLQHIDLSSEEDYSPVAAASGQEQIDAPLQWEELHRRIAELEERQEKLLETHSDLSAQLEEQRRWIKEKTEEERDRQLITNLRSYQGRKKKARSPLFSIFGLLPRRSREA
ncbi:MerR family transcriptional regulator [Paenibacillus sp. P96]|uniref:MerR family transcriptional regulator n=1 Tax=Paenibacillus zeirhizosphaerae TaxID=2987519 RepID=A0ABT9FMP9_9BACL|nr:MerR family transcriptional regulator [Paenibacillus sp. P96]MDP4096014.1 MerR family transcriptional regulator [Paenibacillus sp. P96]